MTCSQYGGETCWCGPTENGCCTALALKGALPVTQLHVDDVKVRRPMRLGPLECRGIFRGEKGDRGPVGPKGDPGPRGGGKVTHSRIVEIFVFENTRLIMKGITES